MSARSAGQGIAVAVLLVLAVVRHDFWWWDAPQRWFGLPVGMAYHLIFCLAVSATMTVLVYRAWPRTPFEERDLD